MARLDRPQVHFNLKTSVIFRMDNLSCDIATSPPGVMWEIACHNLLGLSSVTSPPTRFRLYAVHRFRSAPKNGRHPSDCVDGMLRIRWSTCSGFDGHFRPDYAAISRLDPTDLYHCIKQHKRVSEARVCTMLCLQSNTFICKRIQRLSNDYSQVNHYCPKPPHY